MNEHTGNSSNAFLTTLGLARRAGKLIIGWDRIEPYKGSLSFIIAACDASARTIDNAKRKTETIITVFTMAEIGLALGIRRAAVVAVADKGFAEVLKNRISDVIKS